MHPKLSRSLVLLGALSLGIAGVASGQAKPKAGKWSGDPSVSFTVKPNGTISDFKMSVPLPMGSCDLQFSKVPRTKAGGLLMAGPDGTFSVEGRFRSVDLVEGKVTIKFCPDPEDKHNAVMFVPWVKDWSARAE